MDSIPARASERVEGDSEVRKTIERVYRTESRRVLATLIRLLGDFDTAEDAMHDAFAAAAQQWPKEGIPANPRAWLVSAGRFKAIDAIRRSAKFDATPSDAVDRFEADTPDIAHEMDNAVSDDQLRLIFTCCHPAIAPEARVALTLREVCGLTTEEIGRAFLSSPSTIAQRIVRAKSKIRDARIPYRIPSQSDLPERLDGVLQVIYLVFNEGYSASSGESLTRPDISGEAIRLGRLLMQLLPEPEVTGLLSLMLLQESRRAARTTPNGDLVLLDEQDRGLWDREMIEEGTALSERALGSGMIGPYTVQAAIAGVHARASTPSQTNWSQIVSLYDALLVIHPSPVVELNRAVAVAMKDGPKAGLDLIDAIQGNGHLRDYHLLYSARADLCRRLGQKEEARGSYEKALALARQETEKRFLERRLKALGSK